MRALKIKTAPAMSRSARAPATPSRRDGQGVALVHGGGMYHGDIGRPPPPRLRALLVRAADARAERGELAASRACGTRDMREPPASPRGETACLSLTPRAVPGPATDPDGFQPVLKDQKSRAIAEGYGQCSWPDGSHYEGEWHKGLPHGEGSQVFTNGETYMGEWQAGMRHGFGRWCSGEGHEYCGQWRRGQFHGKGQLQLQGGGGYWGSYANGQMGFSPSFSSLPLSLPHIIGISCIRSVLIQGTCIEINLILFSFLCFFQTATRILFNLQYIPVIKTTIISNILIFFRIISLCC